jgi:V/A-type H+-transporting ATPase subunit C
MFDTGVFGYAGINARVRARYSTQLSTEQWAELAAAPDLAALIDLLRRSPYGPYLAEGAEGALTPRRAVYLIEGQMAEAYRTVIRTAPRQTCALLTLLYRNFEVANLKAVLRGIVSQAAWLQVKYVLFPFGPGTVLPAEPMLTTRSIEAAIELLRGTPYYDTLLHALKRYQTEQGLFPLEVALDLSYWREIWEAIHRLAKPDRIQALRIVGAWLDVNNLMWAIRYRVYYGLSPEELINYTLPWGYEVRDADIRAIAGGTDIVPIVQRIYPKAANIAELLAEPRQGLPALEVQLQRHVRVQCHKALIGYPFHIGVPLAYLVLKKMEIQDLTVLLEAKASRTPPEVFRNYLALGNDPA